MFQGGARRTPTRSSLLSHLSYNPHSLLYAKISSHRGDSLIRVRRLRLINFRNYQALDLRLDGGVTVVEGPNGHGKTNLLEAVYLLSVGRSPRTSADGEMVRRDAAASAGAGGAVHARAEAEVETARGLLRVQVDLVGRGTARARKTFSVNGVRRRSADFVGALKAAMFAAEDLRLTDGPPSVRRRYMDILVSRMERAYLRDVQEYQKLATQRNHLLKAIRQRRSKASELDFWDGRMAALGARIMAARARALATLDEAARPIHAQLGGADGDMSLSYAPSADLGGLDARGEDDARALAAALLDAIRRGRDADVAAGFCRIGPHRDDLDVSIGGMSVGSYASRGQSRTAALAMRLGEAKLLADAGGDQPVILLDDVVSELDPARRRRVLDMTDGSDQTLVATAEPNLADEFGARAVSRVRVESGNAVRRDKI